MSQLHAELLNDLQLLVAGFESLELKFDAVNSAMPGIQRAMEEGGAAWQNHAQQVFTLMEKASAALMQAVSLRIGEIDAKSALLIEQLDAHVKRTGATLEAERQASMAAAMQVVESRLDGMKARMSALTLGVGLIGVLLAANVVIGVLLLVR